MTNILYWFSGIWNTIVQFSSSTFDFLFVQTFGGMLPEYVVKPIVKILPSLENFINNATIGGVIFGPFLIAYIGIAMIKFFFNIIT